MSFQRRTLQLISHLLVSNIFINIANAAIPDEPDCSKYDSEVNWSRCDMSGQNLSGEDLSYSLFTNTNFRGANLSNADLAYSSLAGANLINTNLSNVDLGNTIWINGMYCDKGSIGQCNQVNPLKSLNDTYFHLADSYKFYDEENNNNNDDEEEKKKNEKNKEDQLKLARASLRVTLLAEANQITYAQARTIVGQNIDTEDMITFATFDDEEKVVLISGHPYYSQSFLSFVNGNNFRIDTPLRQEIIFQR